MGKIFKISTDTDSDNKYTHMFGAYVSSDDNALITLCALFRRTSKQLLFRDILADWVRESNVTLSEWITLIGEQCYHIWEADYKTSIDQKQALNRFRKALMQDLKARHLSDDVVTKIINKFDDFNK